MLFGESFYRVATGLYRWRARVPGEDGGERSSGVVLHAGQHMLVGGHGERRVGVPEPFGDDFDRHPVAKQQAGVRVAEIMQSYRCHREGPMRSGEGL